MCCSLYVCGGDVSELDIQYNGQTLLAFASKSVTYSSATNASPQLNVPWHDTTNGCYGITGFLDANVPVPRKLLLLQTVTLTTTLLSVDRCHVLALDCPRISVPALVSVVQAHLRALWALHAAWLTGMHPAPLETRAERAEASQLLPLRLRANADFGPCRSVLGADHPLHDNEPARLRCAWPRPHGRELLQPADVRRHARCCKGEFLLRCRLMYRVPAGLSGGTRCF